MFRLGRTEERVEFCGNARETLARGCELLPAMPGGDRFVTLICGGLSPEDAAQRAEELAEDGTPVITLIPDTTEQLRSFFRFSAALWESLG